jgi:hypothetical protein
LSFRDFFRFFFGFLDLGIDGCISILIGDLKFSQALRFFLNIFFIKDLFSLLGLTNELSFFDGDWMLFDELFFSDLFSFFQFLLKLLKSRSSRLPDRLFESDLDGFGILWRRTDIIDWDLEDDRLW